MRGFLLICSLPKLPGAGERSWVHRSFYFRFSMTLEVVLPPLISSRPSVVHYAKRQCDRTTVLQCIPESKYGCPARMIALGKHAVNFGTNDRVKFHALDHVNVLTAEELSSAALPLCSTPLSRTRGGSRASTFVFFDHSEFVPVNTSDAQ